MSALGKSVPEILLTFNGHLFLEHLSEKMSSSLSDKTTCLTAEKSLDFHQQKKPSDPTTHSSSETLRFKYDES